MNPGWFLIALIVWFLGWGALEALVEHRRRKRDKYWAVNE